MIGFPKGSYNNDEPLFSRGVNLVQCRNCGRELNESADVQKCPFCGYNPELESSSEGIDIVPEDLSIPLEYSPWEDHENIGFAEGLFRTLKLTMLNPHSFFAGMPKRSPLSLPIWYAFLIETTGAVVGLIWSLNSGNQLFGSISTPLGVIAVGILLPFAALASVLLWAVVLHVSLLMVGGAKDKLETTLRLVCYTSGPELLNVIPVVGGIVGLFWKIYITIVAITKVHGISAGRASVAVMLPGLLCCGLPLVGLGIALALLA